MSYRQLGLLALTKRREEFSFNPLSVTNRQYQTADRGAQFALRDWNEMRSSAIAVLEPPATSEGPGFRLTPVGESCYELLGLDEMPAAELHELATLLLR
jgi:hypothetical protein